MAAITAGMVKELREISGAGMMDCKKALTETDGNFDKAIEFLREKGLATAQKKAGRIAAEGLVATLVTNSSKTAAIVEVNSETDFVAKNDIFKEFVNQVVEQVSVSKSTTIEEFKAEKWIADSTVTVEEKLAAMIAKIGENINIRRFSKIEITDGIFETYIHAGGKIGVIVEAKTNSDSDVVKDCLKNVAMQIAALNPKYTSSDEVSEEYKESEKAILLAQAKADPKNEGKPDNILEKMMMGRLNKVLKEVCLLEQEYVKAENKETVQKYVEQIAKANGIELEIKGFVRFETGEGIEKKEENFAEEVAKQMGM